MDVKKKETKNIYKNKSHISVSLKLRGKGIPTKEHWTNETKQKTQKNNKKKQKNDKPKPENIKHKTKQ